MFAVDRTPSAARSRRSAPSAGLHRGPRRWYRRPRRLDTDPALYESGTRLQERITNLASRSRRRRAAQRDGPSREPERDRPRAPRARPAVPVGARRRDRPDPQRDPRARRRAGRRGLRHRGRAPSGSGRRAGPPRSSGLNPTAPSSSSLEILVDSIAAADRRPGRRDARARPRRPAARRALGRRRRAPTWPRSAADLRAARTTAPIVGIGVAVAGVVRRERRPRVDGPQPRLGRRPARRRAWPGRSRSRSRSAIVERRRRRRPGASTGAARPSGVDNVLFISGEVGVGGGLIVDGRLLTGAAGLRRRGRPPARSTRTARRAAAARSAAGRPRSARASCSRGPGYPPDAGRRGVDAVLREAEAGDAGGARGPRPRRPLAGHRARRPRERPQPAARHPRRPARPAPPVRRATRSTPSSTAMRPARRRGRSSGSSRRRSGVDAPLDRRGGARVRAAARRPGGLVRPPRDALPPGERLMTRARRHRHVEASASPTMRRPA